jgi:hypothetical protein
VKQETSPDIHSQNASAVDALQEPRGMPPGAQRTNALKKAGLLRRVEDSQRVVFAKRGRPRKYLSSRNFSHVAARYAQSRAPLEGP